MQAAELFANVSTCLEAIPAMILDDVMAITAQLRTYTDSGVHQLAISLNIYTIASVLSSHPYYRPSCVLDRADDSIVVDCYGLH